MPENKGKQRERRLYLSSNEALLPDESPSLAMEASGEIEQTFGFQAYRTQIHAGTTEAAYVFLLSAGQTIKSFPKEEHKNGGDL